VSGRLSTSDPNEPFPAAPSYFAGMKVCRNIKASLIRESLEEMRRMRDPTEEVRALAKAVRETTDDAILMEDWRGAVDGLRVLYHASPVGTGRQRAQLLGVAANRRLVAAMRDTIDEGGRLFPTWAAVLIAEGSRASATTIRRYVRSDRDEHSRGWVTKLTSYAQTAEMRALIDDIGKRT
jgi:hypothetical protein